MSNGKLTQQLIATGTNHAWRYMCAVIDCMPLSIAGLFLYVGMYGLGSVPQTPDSMTLAPMSYHHVVTLMSPIPADITVGVVNNVYYLQPANATLQITSAERLQ